MPPMSPQEMASIRAMIADSTAVAVEKAIRNVVQPLQDELSSLKVVDVRHEERMAARSAAHKDLATNVRASQVATMEKVVDVEGSSLDRDARIMGAIDAFERRSEARFERLERGQIAPTRAAEGAELAANQVRGETRAISAGQDLTNTQLGKTRQTVFISIVVAIALGIFQIVFSHFVPPVTKAGDPTHVLTP